MSWLSDFLSALKPSSREEHFWAKIAGEEELENEYIPSAREEGFMYKIAQKIQGGSLPDASEASEGDVLTIDDGEPVWAAGGGGGGEKLVIPIDLSESGGVIESVSAEDYMANYDNCVFDCGSHDGVVFPTSYVYQEQGEQRIAMTTALIVRPQADSLATITIAVCNYGDSVAFMQEERTYEMTPAE